MPFQRYYSSELLRFSALKPVWELRLLSAVTHLSSSAIQHCYVTLCSAVICMKFYAFQRCYVTYLSVFTHQGCYASCVVTHLGFWYNSYILQINWHFPITQMRPNQDKQDSPTPYNNNALPPTPMDQPPTPPGNRRDVDNRPAW